MGTAVSSVSVEITASTGETIQEAMLRYRTAASPGPNAQSPPVDVTGNVYSFELPTLPNDEIVEYWVYARQTGSGGINYSDLQVTRNAPDGVTSLVHIQETPRDEEGPSPFVGMTIDMDITVVVLYSFSETGQLVVVEQGRDGEANSGIVIEGPDAAAEIEALQSGELIRITRATILEDNGMTKLAAQDLVFEHLGSATPPSPLSTTTSQLLSMGSPEMYEGTYIDLVGAVVVSTNPHAPSGPYGDFSVASPQAVDSVLNVVDLSSGVFFANDDPASILAVGERLSSVRGVLWYNGSQYELIPATMGDLGSVVNTDMESIQVPNEIILFPNWPNPFNPKTNIQFSLPEPAYVRLTVSDMLGREVARLIDATLHTGNHHTVFNAAGLATGPYMYRLETPRQIRTGTMLLLR